MASVQNNNWQQSLVGNTNLHRAQDAAIRAIDSYYFSKYTEAYIESFEGTARTVLRIYSRTYTNRKK